jgi:hypothetical protein
MSMVANLRMKSKKRDIGKTSLDGEKEAVGVSGRWSGGAGAVITDRAYRRLRGGHHYVPKEIWEKLF